METLFQTRSSPLNRAGRFYERRLARLLPRYAALSLPACVLGGGLYQIANRVVPLTAAHNVMTAWDARIPLRPAWLVFYLGAYLFWVVNFTLIARRGQERWYRFFAAYMLGSVAAFLTFLFFPTTMTRPEVTGEGFGSWVVRLVYASDNPLNLAPSLHCMSSWLCAVGLHSERRIPWGYRAFSYVFALAVCASTLLVRQHCLVDVVTGVALAQGVYSLSRYGQWHRPFVRFFDRLDRAVFARE